MNETMPVKIPLDPYEDLLWVQERLAIYNSMFETMERSLLLFYGKHDIEWCQQFTVNPVISYW